MYLNEIVDCAMGKRETVSDEVRSYIHSELGESASPNGEDHELCLLYLEGSLEKIRNV